jgi:glucose/arabinose dehydrogenase
MGTRAQGTLAVLVLALTVGIGSGSGPSVNAALDDIELRFAAVATGLTQPVLVTHAGDGSGRLFTVEREGIIRVIDGGQSSLFLDISDQVHSQGQEQGLLGLAFDPDFENNGRFYVNYTASGAPTGHTRISMFTPVAGGFAEVPLVTVPQPFANHNGGHLAFGPDSLLYSGLGDGGSGGDPGNRAQDRGTLLGKLIRIDPRVPGAVPEIVAVGLRNPWRWSFDRLTADLYLGDVGQQTREEVNVVPWASLAGTNFGWSIVEGSDCFKPSFGCDTSGLTPPVLEYPTAEGCAVTGGYVYRGALYPRLEGVYLFADYCTGTIWGMERGASGDWRTRVVAETDFSVSSFGEDEFGELYVVDLAGAVYHIAEAVEEERALPLQARLGSIARD